MDHFKGINDQERYNNDLLNEMRKQTALLEQIAQLLQPKSEPTKRTYQRGKQSEKRS